jgi:hypothetical protein
LNRMFPNLKLGDDQPHQGYRNKDTHYDLFIRLFETFSASCTRKRAYYLYECKYLMGEFIMCINRRFTILNVLALSLILIGIVLLNIFGMGMAAASPSLQGSTPVSPALPGTEPGGPFYHQIHLVHSTDGLTWTDDEVIREHASVPSIVRWNDTLWIYVAEPIYALTVLRQDGGVWWETRVQIEGFDRVYAVDPDVVILPDGRLRLYFLDIREIATSTIHSAVSSDGVHFTDEGVRFQKPSPGTDPDVVQAADGTWWMYVLDGTGTAIAHSTDGLTFTQVGTSSTGPMSDTVLLDDGALRRYYSRPGCILSEVSRDSLTWTLDDGVRIEGIVAHPSVARLADSSWLMAYVLDVTPEQLRAGTDWKKPTCERN